jgi:hypothetical protein
MAHVVVVKAGVARVLVAQEFPDQLEAACGATRNRVAPWQ